MNPRQQAIDEFRHAVQGVWLDLVLRQLEPAELSRRLRLAQTTTDRLAEELYDRLAKNTNGQPKPQEVKK